MFCNWVYIVRSIVHLNNSHTTYKYKFHALLIFSSNISNLTKVLFEKKYWSSCKNFFSHCSNNCWSDCLYPTINTPVICLHQFRVATIISDMLWFISACNYNTNSPLTEQVAPTRQTLQHHGQSGRIMLLDEAYMATGWTFHS